MTDEAVATKQDLALTEVRLSEKIQQAQLETTRSVRNWVAGVGGVIALLMAVFEFIGA